MSDKVVNCRKYKLIAPDGGWGYMICVGAIINISLVTGSMVCFGMLYKTLFIELKMDSTSVTLLNGIGAFFVAVSGIFTAPLLKILSIRKLGLITAVAFNIGTFMVVFVRSKIVFFVSFGILQSFGNGVLYNLSSTALNNYFVKKRILVVSIVNTFVGLLVLFSPQFLNWSLKIYGFRGTLLLVSGISLQSIVGTALMQPVEWHMEKVEVPEDKENGIESKLLLRSEANPGTSNKEHEDMKMIKSAEDVKNFNKAENVKPCRFIKTIMSSILDETLLKAFLLSNACVGTALVIFVEITFINLLPQALYAVGLNDDVVAWALSMYASGDLATRFLFIFSSNLLYKFGSHETYVIGLVLSFISRIGMHWSDNELVIIVFITIMGISRCFILTLLHVVVADAVEPKNFSSAIGLVFLLFGFFSMVVGPIIGAIRDLTDSYSTAFCILTSFIGVVIVSWTTELIYKKNKHKRQPKEHVSKV